MVKVEKRPAKVNYSRKRWGRKTIVVALGGNAILREKERGTAEEQYANLEKTSENLMELLVNGLNIVLTHGNGPQVGNLLVSMEEAKDKIPPLPLDICGAMTQGSIGYMIQQSLANKLLEKGKPRRLTTIVTQVVVDENDPAFKNPTKPIGPFYTEEEAWKLKEERGWEIIEDSQRGYRRVVPSPEPMEIVEKEIIKKLATRGEVVIAVGGGGIPVVRQRDGRLRGVEAVIDKDLASSRLALDIGADLLLILTNVEKVAINFGKPNQQDLDNLQVKRAEELLAQGEFAPGSMEPKIRAALNFLKGGGKEVIITLPEKAAKALQREAGTRIPP